jgi:hypothetical protein
MMCTTGDAIVYRDMHRGASEIPIASRRGKLNAAGSGNVSTARTPRFSDISRAFSTFCVSTCGAFSRINSDRGKTGYQLTAYTHDPILPNVSE